MESVGVLMTCPPIYPYLIEQLEKRFTLYQFQNVPDKTQFLNSHKNSIRAVVGNAGFGADAELIDQLPKLEIVSSYSVGLDKVDLAKCKGKGIRVTNTPDVLTDDVADLAIGLMLAVLRRLCESDRYVRSGQWRKGDYKLTTKFTGKSVGIIGLGRIGMAIAKRAEAFSCPISYFARSEKPDMKYKYYPSVVELAANCQILVVACALTEETHHIVNREVINALGPKGVLINIGRGPHVDEPELVSALLEGRLGGAGLDVFEDEPNVPEQLFSLENVVLLPHVGSGTVETRTAMADLVVGNLEAHFLNKPLLTPVVNHPYKINLCLLKTTLQSNYKRSHNSNCTLPHKREGDSITKKKNLRQRNKQRAQPMESIGVLMTCPPMNPYLVEELEKRFTLYNLYNIPDKTQFLNSHSNSIRAVVGNSGYGIDADLIDQLPNLEIVSSHSVGLDKVDLAKCKEKRIRVTNTPDVLTDDVADLAIGLMLAVMRRLCESDQYLRSGKWKKGDYKLTTKFTGKSVGIIGLGRIGMAIAKRAEAFSCPISYYARTEKTVVNYKYYQSVVEMAGDCQILVVSCALTEETRHIVNREVIDALGPKGILINIGRGSHVDEPELVSALLEGRLGGAGLDVFEDEPNVPEQLFGLENVVLLPHVGTRTFETRIAMAYLVVGNLEAHFSNKPLLTPVV
eukprot:XP_002516029.2 uncharacterized protein LOC8274481 [Ricinus communis]